MQKRSNLIITGILIFGAVVMTAQNGTNSPYTRYGYGDMANRSFGAGRSMGGLGIGLHSSKQINPMNPATYAFMDSLTFLFDFGASFQMSFYNDGTNKQNDLNGNIEYVAMQFPLFKRTAMSVGLIPFSQVGYKFGEAKTSEDGMLYSESFEGTGGLNQLYAGLSIELWKKRLSIGSNIHYLFGSITHTAQTQYGSTNTTGVRDIKTTKFTDATFDFGLQSVTPLSKTENLVIGMVFSPQKQLNNKLYRTVVVETMTTDTISSLAYGVPAGYGLGISYIKERKLMIAADYTFQEWSKAPFEGNNDVFNNRSRIAAGFELIPNFYSQPYFNRVRYRAGLNYSNSYVKINGNGYKEYGVTAGIGFPITDDRSFVNFSLEYLKKVPDIKTMINENYFRVTLSFTFNEYWFFKRKMD